MTTVASIVRTAAARAWALEPDQTVSEWADANRILSPVASAEPGQWRTDRTPYLREIMDLLSVHDPTEELCFQKGAQVGASEALLNWIAYTIEVAPAPMLVVQPTLDLLKKFAKQRLVPALDASPGTRAALAEGEGATMFTIEFQGGMLMLTTARSASGLSSMPIARLGCDEVDRYDGDVGGEGDPIELAKMRTATFARRKCGYFSTPKLRGVSRIERLYQSSDQRRYFVPCPQCGHMDYLTWSGFRDFIAQQDGGHHRIGWTGEGQEPDRVFMVCGNQACAAEINEGEKTEMLARGEWRSTLPEEERVGKMPGFHLSALYSPLGWYSWSKAVKQFRHVKTKPEEFQTWVNTVLGETWEERGQSVGWEALRDRAEEYPQRVEGEGEAAVKVQLVPRGVGILVAAVDVQADRLEWAIYGFGAGEECWLVAFGREDGDPATDRPWIDLDRQLLSAFEHESGQLMKIDAVAIDAGYQTDSVLAQCRARLEARRNVWPVRGGAESGQPFVGSPSRTSGYKVPLYTLCTDTGKGMIYARLLLQDRGPGYIHFPDWTKGDAEYFQQLTAEKAVRKWVNGRSSRTWMKLRDRNEQLDLLVYAMAALYIRGGGRAPLWLKAEAEKWAKPPEGPPTPEVSDPGVRVPPQLIRRQRRGWVNRW